MDGVNKLLLEPYTRMIKDELSRNREYLERNLDGQNLAEELAKLHEDWNKLQSIVASISKNLKMESRSMMEWYIESMLFTALCSLTKMVLLGLLDSCFQTLRGLVEGIELALGLDVHPEYRSLSVNQKVYVLSSEKKKKQDIIKYALGLLNKDVKEMLSGMYCNLSEDWVHGFGYFKRGAYEFMETGEIPVWQLYSVQLDERKKEVDKLVDYIKRFRELLKVIINKWQLLKE